MRYMRCKCGKAECWTSMGSPECNGCNECKTTLAESPTGHRDLAPHEWHEEWAIDKKTGDRWKERVCVRCMKREKMTDEEIVAGEAPQ